MDKKTIVLGASLDSQRYSNKAVRRLLEHGHTVIPIGRDEGLIQGVRILAKIPKNLTNVDTVTMYLAPKNQSDYYQIIKDLHPNRVIFNPGAENHDFANQLSLLGIGSENSCTLTLLALKIY